MADDIHGIEAHSPERRERILAGARTVFVRDGYEGASMSQIAVAAQVSKGTLYNYFPSKQALFTVFVQVRCRMLVKEVFGEQEEDADSVPVLSTELMRIGRTMLRLMISPDSLAVYRVVVMEASKFPDLAQAFMDAGPKVLMARMAAWLSRQARAGRLAVDDPLFAAEQFFALSQTRVWMRTRTDIFYKPTDAEIDFVVDGAVAVFLAAYGKTR